MSTVNVDQPTVYVDRTTVDVGRPAVSMSWAQFCRFLHETPAKDEDKITLLAVAVRSAGQPNRSVDVDEMMVLLERSRRTVTTALDRLTHGDSPWLVRATTMSPRDRPMYSWRTTKRIDG